MRKLMLNVHINESLYLLMPGITPVIKTVTVVFIGIVKTNTKYRQIKFLKPTSNELVTDIMLLHANKHMGTQTYETIVVPENASLCLLGTIPPSVISTSKEELEKWMGQKK